MIGWVSENITPYSYILIDRLPSRLVGTISSTYIMYLSDEIKKSLESNIVADYKCRLRLLKNFEGHEEILNLIDDNPYGKIWMKFKLNSSQTRFEAGKGSFINFILIFISFPE